MDASVHDDRMITVPRVRTSPRDPGPVDENMKIVDLFIGVIDPDAAAKQLGYENLFVLGSRSIFCRCHRSEVPAFIRCSRLFCEHSDQLHDDHALFLDLFFYRRIESREIPADPVKVAAIDRVRHGRTLLSSRVYAA